MKESERKEGGKGGRRNEEEDDNEPTPKRRAPHRELGSLEMQLQRQIEMECKENISKCKQNEMEC